MVVVGESVATAEEEMEVLAAMVAWRALAAARDAAAAEVLGDWMGT